jgi:uncharacterized membrane protein HdeD (DUF308 family)
LENFKYIAHDGKYMYYGGYSGMHNNNNPTLLLMGVLGVAFGVLFFLQKFEMISVSFEITDNTYLYFFAGFTLLAGIILLYKSLGLHGMMGGHRY